MTFDRDDDILLCGDIHDLLLSSNIVYRQALGVQEELARGEDRFQKNNKNDLHMSHRHHSHDSHDDSHGSHGHSHGKDVENTETRRGFQKNNTKQQKRSPYESSSSLARLSR